MTKRIDNILKILDDIGHTQLPTEKDSLFTFQTHWQCYSNSEKGSFKVDKKYGFLIWEHRTFSNTNISSDKVIQSLEEFSNKREKGKLDKFCIIAQEIQDKDRAKRLEDQHGIKIITDETIQNHYEELSSKWEQEGKNLKKGTPESSINDDLEEITDESFDDILDFFDED